MSEEKNIPIKFVACGMPWSSIMATESIRDYESPLKILNNLAAASLLDYTPVASTLNPVYAASPHAVPITRPTTEEQYSNIQEQLSDLTRINNEERKEHAEIQIEKDKQIAKLQKENGQLIKKLGRAKAKAKSYKDELTQKERLVEMREDIDNLSERVRTIEDGYNFRQEHR